jgi:hypothetical protein
MDPSRISPLTVTASPKFAVAQLPRVAASSHETVWTFIDKASPAVFMHDPAEPRTDRLLTPNDLRRVFQDESVGVSVSHGGAFRPPAGSEIPGRRMRFKDFAAYVDLNHHGDEQLYLAQFPLGAAPHIRESDLATPSYIPADLALVGNNLWFGPARTITPLHFDCSHNLLHQHWGRKYVIMVDPRHQLELFKPGSKNSGTPHVSSFDLVAPDFNIDLARLGACCFETILEPGDVLFVPAFWWHHVVSIDVSISINYWWQPPISACLYPGFFRMLSSRSFYLDPSVVTQWVDIAPHKLDIALSLFLADEGHTFGAAALAGAIVTAFCAKTLRMLGIPDSQQPLPEAGAGSSQNFSNAGMVISALTAQGLINSSQCDLLTKWVELAAEIAAEPEPRVYSPERSAAVRRMISRLHSEFGAWLSM